MNQSSWTDIWFALPNYSRERALLISYAWAEVAAHGDSAALSSMQMNMLDGYAVCNQMVWIGLPVPPAARALLV